LCRFICFLVFSNQTLLAPKLHLSLPYHHSLTTLSVPNHTHMAISLFFKDGVTTSDKRNSNTCLSTDLSSFFYVKSSICWHHTVNGVKEHCVMSWDVQVDTGWDTRLSAGYCISPFLKTVNRVKEHFVTSKDVKVPIGWDTWLSASYSILIHKRGHE
jgi:hypothetical protein